MHGHLPATEDLRVGLVLHLVGRTHCPPVPHVVPPCRGPTLLKRGQLVGHGAPAFWMGGAQGPREAAGLGSHIHLPGGRGEDGESDRSHCWGPGRQREAGSRGGQGRRRLVRAGVGTPPGSLPTCGPGESEGLARLKLRVRTLLEPSSSLAVGTSSSPRRQGAPALSPFRLWLAANLPFPSIRSDPNGLRLSHWSFSPPPPHRGLWGPSMKFRTPPQSLGDISTHCHWSLAFGRHISFAQF